MKNLNPSRLCLMVLILNYFNSESEGALPHPTLMAEYTTKPTPTVDIDPQASWMSPSRVQHQSKFVESVIFEPQPRIMLSRSTYKVTSFIDFMPYREAFKKFETFFRKFKNNINDPDHVGPLINVNATKGESWKGPKEGKFGKRQRTRVKRNIDLSVQQDNIGKDDMVMLTQIRHMKETDMLDKNHTISRKKRFIVAASILGWKIHENKKEIEKLKGAVNTLYHQNKLQQDQILETARFLNITYGYVTENRMSINELQIKLAVINHTLIETMSEIKLVKYTIAVLTDARSALA